MAKPLMGVKIYICFPQIYVAYNNTLEPVIVQIREGDTVLAQSPVLDSIDHARKWITAIKRVTIYTKVIDETGK